MIVVVAAFIPNLFNPITYPSLYLTEVVISDDSRISGTSITIADRIYNDNLVNVFALRMYYLLVIDEFIFFFTSLFVP